MRFHRLILEERLRALGLPGAIGVLALVAATLLTLAGLQPAREEGRQLAAELARARQPANIEAVVEPAQQAARLLAALPLQDEATGALQRVFAAAGSEGLSVSVGEYLLAEDAGGAMLRYQIRVPLRGGYPQIRRFVEHCLEALPTLGLEEIDFRRQAIGERELDATLRLSLYLARPR